MGDDDIVVEIHHGAKFVDGVQVEYVGSGVSEIEHVNIDKLSRFEIIRLVKDIGFTNVEEFYYLIPSIRAVHYSVLSMVHNVFIRSSIQSNPIRSGPVHRSGPMTE